MQLDIQTAVRTAFILCIIGAGLCVFFGTKAILTAKTLRYFRLRRERVMQGWQLILLSPFVGILGYAIIVLAEPIAYRYYPPTATNTMTITPSITPTVTLTPTITLSPTITLTQAVSYTPTETFTPHVPLPIEASFESTVTPVADAIFSPLFFSQTLNLTEPTTAETFTNPVGHMYAMFSYNEMTEGAQWTAVWYRNGDLVFFESKPWDGGSGGYGFSDWNPPSESWLPGKYEVQIFVGLVWRRSGEFVVEGEPPTSTPTVSLTPTPTLTLTPTPTHDPNVTPSLTPTITLSPTATRRSAIATPSFPQN